MMLSRHEEELTGSLVYDQKVLAEIDDRTLAHPEVALRWRSAQRARIRRVLRRVP
jgi:hypothetical protein